MPTVLITGGHGGVGLSCVKYLAEHENVNIVLAGRSIERMVPVAEQLKSSYGAKVSILELDTSSLASVRKAAAQCITMLGSGEIDSLDAILCNAGANIGKVAYTEDGYEQTFATNVLGHFLLVDLLVDHVAAEGRIVFTVSGTHDPDTVDGKLVGRALEPDAIALANNGKNGVKAASSGKRYTTSKLCMVMLAYELDRRLKRRGSSISSIAYDPGAVPGTGLARELPAFAQRMMQSSLTLRLTKMIGITQGSLPFSGESLARLAIDRSYANGSGKYFQSNNGRLIEQRSSKVSYDEQRAVKLWNDMEYLTGIQQK